MNWPPLRVSRLMLQVLAPHQSNDKGLTLEMSALKLLKVASLFFLIQMITPKYLVINYHSYPKHRN